jgi:hypothetical protein
MRKKADSWFVARVILPLLLSLAGCGTRGDTAISSSDSTVAQQVLGCGADSAAIIAGPGLGALQIGAMVSEVKDACSVVRDTVVMGIEGMPSRELTVRLREAQPVVAEIVDDSVWRIRIRAAPPFTSDSIGVGSTVAELASRGSPEILLGEGKAYLTLDSHCGVSFGLNDAPLGKLASARTQARMRAVLPTAAKVDEILITGCR